MFGKMDGSRVHSDVRKTKKKQVKDEMDRIRQAEKKRRRLEKALATSAAIRAELEKKKQKKKEEQQRLDEEGAAIAEAVALHVLLEEDSDENSRNDMLNKNEGLSNWRDIYSGIYPYNGISRYWVDGVGWVSNPNHQYESHMGFNDIGLVVSSESVGRIDGRPRYLAEERWNDDAGISVAAQAISSLRICDDNEMDRYVLKPMSRC